MSSLIWFVHSHKQNGITHIEGTSHETRPLQTPVTNRAAVYQLANRGKTEEARAALEEILSGKELHICSKRRCEKREVR